MRIDAHQHFWHYDPVRDNWIDKSMQVIRRDFVPADLEPLLLENNVDGTVAVQADQSEDETQFLLDLANENEFIKGVVGWVDLKSEDVEEKLAYFSRFEKMKGLRHIAQAESNDFFYDEEFRRGIQTLAYFGFTYDILIYSHQMHAAIDLAQSFPKQAFVLDHIAKPDIKNAKLDEWKKNVSVLAENDNVFCKVSGMVTEADWMHWKYDDLLPYLEVVFESFGTERIMAGSDWPVCLVASNYTQVMGVVEEYIDSNCPDQKEKVMGLNALDFYKIAVDS